MENHGPKKYPRVRCPLAEEYASFRQACWMVLTGDDRRDPKGGFPKGFYSPKADYQRRSWGTPSAVLLIGALLLILALLGGTL